MGGPVRFPRVKSLGGVDALTARLDELGLELPCDDWTLSAAQGSPLAEPLELGGGITVANRWVVQPMEGWDADRNGAPTELVERRWRRFGQSGAGWVWGGEAVAVSPEGRANPRQLLLDDTNAPALGALRRTLIAAAGEAGRREPFVGLQLTHSGRWADAGPRVAQRHPYLDARRDVVDTSVLGDRDVDEIVAAFGRAAHLAQEEGFDFVDVKHCHGYLLHEFLGARQRPGRFGGETLAERTRLMTGVLDAIRAAAPGLTIGMRLSLFDLAPPGEDIEIAKRYGFGVGDLDEPLELVAQLPSLGVALLNITGASPYYVPHAQRPAAFPPSDGYAPPEDPLVGVARLLHAARAAARAAPDLVVVSSGWTYLQEYVAPVAQACVRDGWFDAVGLGRMMLSYPTLPADTLAGAPLDTDRICRTFSDCTTAPRHGMVSGCYPLDPFYRDRPERVELIAVKRRARAERR